MPPVHSAGAGAASDAGRRSFREQFMMPMILICAVTVMLCCPAAQLHATDSGDVAPHFCTSACGPGAVSDSRAAPKSDLEAELERLLVDRWQALSQVVARMRSVDDPTPEMGPNLVES